MRSLARRFIDDESGASAVEYALIAGIVALGIVVSAGALRDSLNDILTNASTHVK